MQQTEIDTRDDFTSDEIMLILMRVKAGRSVKEISELANNPDHADEISSLTEKKFFEGDQQLTISESSIPFLLGIRLTADQIEPWQTSLDNFAQQEELPRTRQR